MVDAGALQSQIGLIAEMGKKQTGTLGSIRGNRRAKTSQLCTRRHTVAEHARNEGTMDARKRLDLMLLETVLGNQLAKGVGKSAHRNKRIKKCQNSNLYSCTWFHFGILFHS